jgi:hypothetical protein
MLTERQIDFVSMAATLYLPQGDDVKLFFRSVGNRLGRNPSETAARRVCHWLGTQPASCRVL